MNRGEVWLINLSPTVGAEISKSRPAIIVNDDAIGVLPLRVIVPITEWKDRFSIAPFKFVQSQKKDSPNSLEKLEILC